jgi:hypothetical protein
MKHFKGFPRIAAVVGVGLALVALLWWALAIPALVKYPTDASATPRYAGTFTVYVDQATMAPLAQPQTLPLTIERRIQAIDEQSGSSKVLVDETITQQAGPMNTTQHNVYVMDRSTLKNVADGRAYAFDPANVVDRSGSYRLNMPFGTNENSTYPVYKNEIGTTYVLQGDTAQPTTTEHGLELKNFTASANEVPLSAAYLSELSKTVALPSTVTLDQLKPQLKQLGVDVDALVAAVGPYLTPDETATLGQIASKSIPLHYVLSLNGHTAVEPTTGVEVDVRATESVAARPDFADLPTLTAMLNNHASVPEAAAAAKALQTLATAPATKLFEYTYQQTPQSVADIASTVKSNRSQLLLVQRYVPIGLFVAALVALVAGGLVLWHRHSSQPLDVRAHPPEAEQIPEPERIQSGTYR